MTQQDIINFLNGYNPSGATLAPNQLADLTAQLNAQINQLSVAVPNTQGATTLLYSGQIGNGVHSGAVAQALADANPGKIVTINQTEVASLLDSQAFDIAFKFALGPAGIEQDTAYNRILSGTDVTGATRITTDSLWDAASQRFAASATGDVRTIMPLADSTRVFSQTEVAALLSNSNITSINGITVEDLRQLKTDLLATGTTVTQADIDTANKIVLDHVNSVSAQQVSELKIAIDTNGNVSVSTKDYFTKIGLPDVGTNLLTGQIGQSLAEWIATQQTPETLHTRRLIGGEDWLIAMTKLVSANNNYWRIAA
jgi:hypothetical protein